MNYTTKSMSSILSEYSDKISEDKINEIVTDVVAHMKEEGIYKKVDESLIKMYADAVVTYEAVTARIINESLNESGLNVNALFNVQQVLNNTITKIGLVLGISPWGRKRLKLDTGKKEKKKTIFD